MTYFTGTRADCRTIAAATNKVGNYPRRGVPYGPGPHAPIQRSWDGTGPVPFGWVAYSDQSIRATDETETSFAIPLSPVLDDPELVSTRLTTDEQTTLTQVRTRGTVTVARVR